MKKNLLALAGFVLAGCAVNSQPSSKTDSETVLVTYHVIPGKEQELRGILSDLWATYQQDHLVFDLPHLIVQGTEGDNKPYIAELFTWVSHSAPDHAPDAVQKLWGQMSTCCEKRDGHPPIDGGEVTILLK